MNAGGKINANCRRRNGAPMRSAQGEQAQTVTLQKILSRPTVLGRREFNIAEDFMDDDLFAKIAADIFAETLHNGTDYLASTASAGSQSSPQPHPES